MSGTSAEGIFEKLKTFLSPESILQKVLVPQHVLLKRFSTSTTKPKIVQKVSVPVLQLYNSCRTLNIEQKNKNRKES